MQLPKPKYIDEYTIRYDSMDQFYALVCQKITQWENALKKWENACNNLISMQTFQGQAAMAAKTYLQETNNLLLPAIKQTFAAYKAQFLLYKTGYYAIDSHTYSVIPEEVLRGIMGKLGAEIWDTELLSDDVNAIIDSISDICPLTKPSMDSLQTDLDTLRNDIRNYKDKIDQYEYTKYNQLNTELQPLIDALQNTIKSFLETGENLATYQPGTAAINTELQNLTEQVNIAEQYLQDNQNQIQQAVQQQTAIYAQIEKDQDLILEAQCESRKDQGSAQMLQSTIGATVTVAIMIGAAIVAPVSIFVTTCVVGGGAFLYNASNFYEGAENYYYGSIKDLESIAINPLEDTVFGDDEETYDAFGNFNMTAVGLCGAAMTSMGPGAIAMELMQNTYSGAVTSYLTTGIANTCNLNQTQSVLLGTVLDYAVDQDFDGNRVRYMSDGMDLNGHVHTPDEIPTVTTDIHISSADMPLGVYNEVEGGLDTLDEIKRIDEIEVEFNYNSKYDETEFARQLADQQKGMNELTVQEYLDNRQKYIEQGRAIESNAAQQAAREKAFVDKVDELQDAGLSLKEAEEQAQKWLDTQAALHNPDQVAGGHASNAGGVGDKSVNSSIGSQWRYRIDDVDAQIQKMAESMSEAEKKSTYLNVNLVYKGD